MYSVNYRDSNGNDRCTSYGSLVWSIIEAVKIGFLFGNLKYLRITKNN